MTSLPDSARALLESAALAHLVTLNPDGSPQVSIVWRPNRAGARCPGSYPYTAGTPIGHPLVITPRWATSPASGTARKHSAGPPRCGNRRPVRSVAARDGNSITEIVYQPTGPDIPGELERFITIARDV